MPLPRLDCVIIGYNQTDPQLHETRAQATRKSSGAHRMTQFDMMRYQGQNRSYMDVFNRLASARCGHDRGLNVYNLPALGVSYLQSFLARRGFNVAIVNFFSGERDKLADLLSTSPLSVAITTTFYVSNEPVAEIVRFVRDHAPATRVIVGGPRIYNIFADNEPLTQEIEIEEIGADFYVYDSQGEQTLADLLEQLREGRHADFGKVANLIYTPDGETFQRTTRQLEVNDLEQNAIDWNSLGRDDYIPTALVRTARSCAFECAFCRYPVLAGPLTLRSVANVESELRQLCDAGVRQVAFIDDTFNVPLSRFKDLCRMMTANKFGFEWFSYFRCSNSDDETFSLMAESGCRGVFLGIESGDQMILKNMKKCATVEKYSNGIRRLHENGIVTFVSVIIGFPGESEETVQNTIEFLQSTSPRLYRAELYYHDTMVPIHAQAQRFGLKSAGYSWSHDSMDWRGACDEIQRIYDTIEGPVILPSSFDFWTIPYLMGEGFSIAHFEEFAAISQNLLAYRWPERAPETTAHELHLAALFDESPALSPLSRAHC
jgi:radical SAM PhpK family P-methyltransferase